MSFIRKVIPPVLYTPSGTTQEVNLAESDNFVIELDSATGNVTLSFINAVSGADYQITFIQGGTFRDVVLPSSILMPGATAPTTLDITQVDNAIDVMTLYYNGVVFLSNGLSKNFG